MLQRILFSVVALLVGPVVIILTYPFFKWNVPAGLCTMVIVSGISIVGVWREPRSEQVHDAKLDFITRCWRGEERLWKVFWLAGIGLALALKALSYAGTAFRASVLWWIVVGVAVMPLHIWWIVSVWRCARNSSKRAFEMLGKVAAVASGAGYGYNIILVLALPFGL